MTFLDTKCAPILLTMIFVSSSIYFFPSGVPQPSHILLLLPSVFLIVAFRRIELALPERLLLLFWLYSVSVNIFYWFVYGVAGPLVASAYITYAVMLFFTFRHVFISNPSLSISLLWALLFAVVTLFGLAFLGGEEFFYWKGRRLMGLFNDPNQMSYWLLVFFTASLLIPSKPSWFKPTTALVLWVLIFFLAFLAGSRSALIALLVLALALTWWFFSVDKEYRHAKVSAWRVVAAAAGVLSLLLTLLFVLYLFVEPVQSTVQDLLRRVNARSPLSHLEMRGYLRPIEMPQYLLFGAGQGFDERFSDRLLEVHSSVIGPLFYYGIIGWLLFYGFVYTLALDRLRGWQWLVFAAPFVYGLFTYGLRTPVFWLMLASLYAIPKRSESHESRACTTQ